MEAAYNPSAWEEGGTPQEIWWLGYLTPRALGSARDPASVNKTESDRGNLALPSGFHMPLANVETLTCTSTHVKTN